MGILNKILKLFKSSEASQPTKEELYENQLSTKERQIVLSGKLLMDITSLSTNSISDLEFINKYDVELFVEVQKLFVIELSEAKGNYKQQVSIISEMNGFCMDYYKPKE
tara:strand:- start:3201 stop:3527 length:327 start_codon:yes stop_codon:yes gene_type:complete